MLRLRILSVGKNKEEWLNEALEEYVKRLSSTVQIEFIWAKNDLQLIQFAEKEPFAFCLDVKGQVMNSEQFSHFLIRQFELAGARLAIVIGGPEGLPPFLKNGKALISFSPMTFTHQLARLMLVEQVYRAFEIAKGSRYHK